MTDVARSVIRAPVSAYAAVALLALVLLLNHADRLILGILVEPIRTTFRLSDGQIGLLTGPAFAVVYAVLVLPVARLAEMRNRVMIVTLALLAWSGATAACGLASNFTALMLARMLVGCGEAGGLAPAMSIVSDLFPVRRRATAMAIFAFGASLAIVVTPLVGGALLSGLGWRATLLVFAGVGGVVALMLALCAREPPRGGRWAASERVAPTATPAGPSPTPRWRRSIAALLSQRSYRLLVVANVLVAIAQFAVLFWLPAFFQREHGLSGAALGGALGLYQGAPLLLGNFLGGPLSDWLIGKNVRWMVWMPMATALVTTPVLLSVFLVHDLTLALGFLAIPSFMQGLSAGTTYAVLQSLAPIHSRATATALLGFCVTIFGQALGPLAVGLISQTLSAEFGLAGLRFALLYICPFYAFAAYVYWSMSKSVRRDLDVVQNSPPLTAAST